jgi:flagellar hook-associated protein 1
MSLSQALAAAVSGLHASQTGLALVAANVANADTPGYVRKTPTLVTTAAGDFGVGVQVAAVNRELDAQVQRQLRIESSGASYADLRAQFYQRLQSFYGSPGADGTLETVFNNFTSALQALSTSPDSGAARSTVLNSAQVLSQQLNGMTADIQGLRSDAELGLADAVSRANDAMTQLAKINQQLSTMTSDNGSTASLLDQRDHYIDQLAKVMDIRVVQGSHNQVTVSTTAGIELVGNAAARLSFDAQGAMTATAAWNANPAKRGVGTLLLEEPNGGSVDLIATKAIRSGEIAAYLDMRDQVLPQAQSQLDEIAAGLARALSDRTSDGTPQSFGTQSGFDIDLSGLLNGNTVHVTYTDNATNAQHSITLVRVDDPGARPLPNSATSDPNDRVIGLDFSGGLSSVVSQLTAALGTTGLTFANPSGATLRILDDGLNKAQVNAVSATKTTTTLTGGSAELPFFLDGTDPYSGAISSAGRQATGFAGRIAVNGALLGDPSKLIVYQSSPATAAGDPTRPNFILDALTNGTLTFSPQSGIGTTVAPFGGSVQSFMRQVISQQGAAAQAADDLKQGQDVVFNSLQKRFNDGSGVNIDEEMANLLSLQNAYAANARVLSTVKDMLDTLMKI